MWLYLQMSTCAVLSREDIECRQSNDVKLKADREREWESFHFEGLLRETVCRGMIGIKFQISDIKRMRVQHSGLLQRMTG
jgi:hypothetical protein